MHFVVTCLDKQDSIEIRKANREEHLAFANENTDIICVGGPLLDDDGGMIGSCLICEAEDKASLETFLAQDPYAKAGLFQSVTIQPWKWVLGAPA